MTVEQKFQRLQADFACYCISNDGLGPQKTCKEKLRIHFEYVQLDLPFFGGVLVEGVKNFVTVWTLLDFSLVFLSSNLLKRVMFDCDWAFWCLLAYASSSSLCSLEGERNNSCNTQQMERWTSTNQQNEQALEQNIQHAPFQENIRYRKTGILLSKSLVFLNLLLFVSLIFLSPALRAKALPCSVAIKSTSFFAEQLWLVQMDPSPLAHHPSPQLKRLPDTQTQTVTTKTVDTTSPAASQSSHFCSELPTASARRLLKTANLIKWLRGF